jgi:hypothetical protein
MGATSLPGAAASGGRFGALRGCGRAPCRTGTAGRRLPASMPAHPASRAGYLGRPKYPQGYRACSPWPIRGARACLQPKSKDIILYDRAHGAISLAPAAIPCSRCHAISLILTTLEQLVAALPTRPQYIPQLAKARVQIQTQKRPSRSHTLHIAQRASPRGFGNMINISLKKPGVVTRGPVTLVSVKMEGRSEGDCLILHDAERPESADDTNIIFKAPPSLVINYWEPDIQCGYGIVASVIPPKPIRSILTASPLEMFVIDGMIKAVQALDDVGLPMLICPVTEDVSPLLVKFIRSRLAFTAYVAAYGATPMKQLLVMRPKTDPILVGLGVEDCQSKVAVFARGLAYQRGRVLELSVARATRGTK